MKISNCLKNCLWQNKFQISKGFSLIEIMVTMSVVVLVGTILFGIFVSNTGLFYQQTSRYQQGLGLNDSLVSIRGAIKEADLVSLNYPPSGTPQYSSNDSNLVLRFQAIDSQGNKIYNVFDFAVYTVSEGRLYFKVFPDTQNGSVRKSANQILTNNVSSIKFEYLDVSSSPVVPNLANKVKVTLTLKQKAGKGYETNIATSEANLRND